MPKGVGSNTPETTMANQNAFCSAFSLIGSVTRACDAINLSKQTYYAWKRNDTYGFRAKLERSQEEFGEYIHSLALDAVKNQKPSDNPALKIFMLKAWHPRYKAVDTSVTDDVGKEVMAELKKAFRSEKPEAKKKEDPVDEEHQVIEQANQILASKTNDSSPDRDKNT